MNPIPSPIRPGPISLTPPMTSTPAPPFDTPAPAKALPLRTQLASRAGGAVAALSRRLGRGSGSVVGGRAILILDPGALGRLARHRQVVLVSGTNGKTTTTSLLATALTTAGPVVTNLLGANLPPGLAAALAAAPDAARTAVLEVDEAWLGRVADEVVPAVAVLLNLSRDQLDRNNEVRHLSATWRAVLARSPEIHVVANADDPLVAWAASAASSVTWVGAGQPWTVDAAGCPNCGGRIQFAAGKATPAVTSATGWACSTCSLARPVLDAWIEDQTVVMRDGTRLALHLSLPGRCNQANALMAMVAAGRFGVGAETALAAMAATSEVAGRYRYVITGSTRARLLLAKNPAGWLEVFDLLAPPPTPVVIGINARIADGKDPSWLWDVPFERLRGRLVVATGERSRDLAVRLHYAEVDHRHEPDPILAIQAAGASAVDVVANYTSFQALSRRLDRAARLDHAA
jgi:lipid II isoglutaminyl synthase (glutamine-hydrolysing)